MNDKIYLNSQEIFHAARRLSLLPENHRANSMHGHNFVTGLKIDPLEQTANSLNDLFSSLRNLVNPLDYQLLNDFMDNPCDQNIALKLKREFDNKALIKSFVSSTPQQGAICDALENISLWRGFAFQAAHQLPNVPKDHKCGNMHGHTFEVILFSSSEAVNSHDLELMCEFLFKKLNKKCLNNIKGLENPTSEMIASWAWSLLENKFDSISHIVIKETGHAGCSFDGKSHQIWREQILQSAISDSSNSDIYGYGYLSRLYITAPLDQVYGWTMDFGDVKKIFEPVFHQMDHHYLNDLKNLSDFTLFGLVKWMKSQLQEFLPALDRIDLYESDGNGVELFIHKE